MPRVYNDTADRLLHCRFERAFPRLPFQLPLTLPAVHDLPDLTPQFAFTQRTPRAGLLLPPLQFPTAVVQPPAHALLRVSHGDAPPVTAATTPHLPAVPPFPHTATGCLTYLRTDYYLPAPPHRHTYHRHALAFLPCCRPLRARTFCCLLTIPLLPRRILPCPYTFPASVTWFAFTCICSITHARVA